MGMSQKVLDRIKQRRKERIVWAVLSVMALAVISGEGANVYSKRKSEKMIDAPTWADFRVASGKTFTSVTASTEDGIPAHLTINGEQWSVVRVLSYKETDKLPAGSYPSGLSGETYCRAKTISYIRSDDPNQLRITMLHEVFHAGGCLHGGDSWWNSADHSTDHPGIYHLGEFMATFLHDNPRFANWAE